MSRVGKHPVPVPAGVDVRIDGGEIVAKGKLGELRQFLVEDVDVTLDDGKVVVTPRNEGKKARALWGTMQSIIANMVKGVSEGFKIDMELIGVGYRAAVEGSKTLALNLGYSHDVKMPIPEGVKVTCEKPTTISLHGPSKQVLGQFAAEIRRWRPPEPYKGKGIKYADETILRKEGKKK